MQEQRSFTDMAVPLTTRSEIEIMCDTHVSICALWALL